MEVATRGQIIGVTVAWFEFRVACRSRWKIWTAIGLLAGLAAGIVLVAVAGARRTDSALQRVVVDQHVFDVDVNPNNGALTDVSLDIRIGEVHALVGQNGSGKSTLIKTLAAYHTPDPGARAEAAPPSRWRNRASIACSA